MAFTSRKRKSTATAQDDSDIDAEVPTKRGKASLESEPQVDSDGNTFWEISKNRRVTISDFKGKKLVNIREYYQKDNEWLPAKKGISMSLEQYSALIGIMPQIEEQLKQQGETVPRPNYSGSSSAATDGNVKEEGDSDKEETNCKKANIEATSDEEE